MNKGMEYTGVSRAVRFKFMLWAGARFLTADKSCPACKEPNTVLVRRKFVVTALRRCPSCELMFRHPKPKQEEVDDFYQEDYTSGFTTDCPTPEELNELTSTSFAGTDRDFSSYVDVLRSIPLAAGSTILDFGCSWGYGSWQLAQAGYKVYSCELSSVRARYAAEKLGCTICTPENLPEKVDCLFSACVLEHLPNPRVMWEMARNVVKPGGVVVHFLPNGNPELEKTDAHYHHHWGLAHLTLISPLALSRMSELYGFTPRCYSSPYNLQEITTRTPGAELGTELLVVATR
jgi:SAM-dependent methyltransferase